MSDTEVITRPHSTDAPSQNTESPAKRVFIRSDGAKIKDDPELFTQTSVFPSGCTDFHEFVANHYNRYTSGINFFFGKLCTASVVEMELRQLQLLDDTPRDAILDICSGPAILPRALKARGLFSRADAIDLTAREQDFSPELFADLWRCQHEGRPIDRSSLTKMQQQVSSHFYSFPTLTPYFDDPFDADALQTDHYYEKDFYTHPIDQQYDLITLISGVEYFEPQAFYAKVSSLLKPGGVFYTHNKSFYEIGGGTLYAPGGSLSLHTYLTKEDFLRYYDELYPEFSNCARTVYFHPCPHMIVEDHADHARKHGLEVVLTRRSTPEKLANVYCERPDIAKLLNSEVMPLARALNPRVSLRDYLTNYFTLVVRKPAS